MIDELNSSIYLKLDTINLFNSFSFIEWRLLGDKIQK